METWLIQDLDFFRIQNITMKTPNIKRTSKTVGFFLVVFCGTAFSALALSLTPLATFGPNGDGSLRPGDVSFLTVGGAVSGNPYQRGMAYNPTTGHLLVVHHESGNEGIHILDSTNGTVIGQLALTNAAGNPLLDTLAGNVNFIINCIGIGDDGAIYVANLSNSTGSGFPQIRIYRWASEESPGALVFSGDPSNNNGTGNVINKRWGDTMAVRGAGLNTQILMASRGTQVAIFTPSDAEMTTFISNVLNTDTPAGALGTGLAFGSGASFYGTAGATTRGPLYLLNFNLAGGTATTSHIYSQAQYAGNVTPMGVNLQSNLLVGVEMVAGADVVRLYDVSNITNAPVLLDRKYFFTTNDNGIYAGAIAFADNRVFVLDSDNGIMAYTYSVAVVDLPPAIILPPAGTTVAAGANYTLTVGADGSAPLFYQWQKGGSDLTGETTSSLVLTNIQESGSYSVIVSNSSGSVTSSAVAVTVSAEVGSLIWHDPLNYEPGTALGGQGGWVLNNGTAGIMEAGNLSVVGLSSSTGNRYTWGSAAHNVRRDIGTNDTGILYYSFILQCPDLGTLGSGFLAGFTTNTSSTYAPRTTIRAGAVAGTYNLGVQKNGGTAAWATNNFTTGESVFVVARYTFRTGSVTDDVCDMWINPDPSTFGSAVPPSSTLRVTSGNDLSYFDRFNFRAGSSTTAPAKHVADEVRVAMTWALATPQAVAALPSLSVTLSDSSAVISWPTNSTDFTLEGTTNLNSPITWATVTNSVNVTGTNNTVTVSATSGNQFFRLKK
jgi:hypothetical protein